jgi:hypothetical protein
MTQALVTRQQVFDAADELKHDGKPVTGYGTYNLRPVGSLTTHYKYVAEWLKLQGASASNTPERTSIPEVLANVTADLNARLAKIIEAEVQIRVDGQATAFRTAAAEANQQSASVMADCECILADLNEERRCHSETQSANEAAIEQIAQLKLEFADASARALAAELREGELRKHVDDLKSELATHGDLHKAAQEQSTQLRQEIARMQAKIDQTGIDAAALQIEIAAARAAAAAANERATADAAKAFAEIKALTIACEDAHRDAKEHSALAARLSGELGAVRRQADDYLALVKKRQAGSATLAARGSKSHAN